MWVSGITQGLMLRAINADGTLTYSFLESLIAIEPYFIVRFLGGVFYLIGMIIMAYNCYKTLAAGSRVTAPIPAVSHS